MRRILKPALWNRYSIGTPSPRARHSILSYSAVQCLNLGHASSRANQVDHARARRKDVVPKPDTIYALSTAPGRAAIAVIRVSGPACLDIYGGLCPGRPFPTPRTATLRKLQEPSHEESSEIRVLDSAALVLYFPAPRSVTGEDTLELHVHGGLAIVKSVLEAIPRCIGARTRRRHADYSLIRHAEPGEFTKRAFYNGRIDLTQAEALGEVLAAETEQQRRLAIMGADSDLSRRYEDWRQMLLYARGELEALIDFSEDQHFDESPGEFISSVSSQVSNLSQEINLHVRNASRGELLRNGISLALIGAPNAGKSSLLNRIVGRDAAIVSAEAGTTRDIVDVSVDIGGWLCRLGDMAGLRAGGHSGDTRMVPISIGVVEREGIRRARTRAMQSDVVIVLLSLEQQNGQLLPLSINAEVHDTILECQAVRKTIVVVINKADLLKSHEAAKSTISDLRQQVLQALPGIFEDQVHVISCLNPGSSAPPTKDPGGIQKLLAGLTDVFTSMTAAQMGGSREHLLPGQAQAYWTASLAITHRQSAYLQQCLAHLQDFLAQTTPPSDANSHHVDGHRDLVGEVRPEADIVTAAEHLRYSAACLAKITGKGESGDVEDVLGVVFEK